MEEGTKPNYTITFKNYNKNTNNKEDIESQINRVQKKYEELIMTLINDANIQAEKDKRQKEEK